MGYQPPVAGDVSFAVTSDLCFCVCHLAPVIKDVAIFKLEPIPWIKWPKFNVILASSTVHFEKFIKKKRRCNYGWAGIESKAISLECLGSSTQPGAAVYQLNIISFGTEA
jgi:hypothetical protein